MLSHATATNFLSFDYFAEIYKKKMISLFYCSYKSFSSKFFPVNFILINTGPSNVIAY